MTISVTNMMKIAMACDAAAYTFKTELKKILDRKGYVITDFGCDSSESGEYPVFAKTVGEKVAGGEFDRGILICGTGQGMCIAANKIKGVRAALCYDVLPAIMSREHNDANILTTGAWIVSVEKAVQVIEAWLFGRFAKGKHESRIRMIEKIEDD
ncbi:Ribose-5-phosphate isomerase B [subsurface metagenome]